jgi:hypothetical protein
LSRDPRFSAKQPKKRLFFLSTLRSNSKEAALSIAAEEFASIFTPRVFRRKNQGFALPRHRAVRHRPTAYHATSEFRSTIQITDRPREQALPVHYPFSLFELVDSGGFSGLVRSCLANCAANLHLDAPFQRNAPHHHLADDRVFDGQLHLTLPIPFPQSTNQMLAPVQNI